MHVNRFALALLAVSVACALLTFGPTSEPTRGAYSPDPAETSSATSDAGAAERVPVESSRPEPPYEAATIPAALEALSPRPTIDGKHPSESQQDTLRSMRAFMKESGLSTQMPDDLPANAWEALSNIFEVRLRERARHADVRQQLLMSAARQKFRQGDFEITSQHPTWTQDGSHKAWRISKDERTNRPQYRVVVVAPGELPDADWLRKRISNMDHDTALVIRSFLDRFL